MGKTCNHITPGSVYDVRDLLGGCRQDHDRAYAKLLSDAFRVVTEKFVKQITNKFEGAVDRLGRYDYVWPVQREEAACRR